MRRTAFAGRLGGGVPGSLVGEPSKGGVQVISNQLDAPNITPAVGATHGVLLRVADRLRA